MSLWRQLTHGLRALAHPEAADRDLNDEMRHYLEQAAAAGAARGMTAQDALRAARIELGSPASVRDEVRDYGWENALGVLYSDLRYAARRLRHSPGFAAVCVLTLALGIGANTAIFSVIRGVLLKPLPYPQPDALVALWTTAPGVNIKDLNMSPSLYFTFSDENRVFEGVSLWSTSTSSITGITQPEEVPVLMATYKLLPLLKVHPSRGRAFNAMDERSSSAPTVMLSDGYWHSRFGADPAVLGRRITVDGRPTEVIGVLPPSFDFMDQKFSLLMSLQFDRAATLLLNFSYQGVARLKPGVTMEQANADIARMLPMVPLKFPPNPGFNVKAFTDARLAPNLRPLKDDLIGDSGATLWVLMAAVGLVLLMACANVANLSLVRADGRRQELAVRAALGAGWGRIARELLAESLVLSAIGGTLGLGVAYAALRVLASSDLPSLPRIAAVAVDPWVVAFTIGVSVASGVLFGLIPVFKYARPQLQNALRSGGRSLSAGRDRHRARNILVVVQVALALVLLVGSGLMVRTFQALHRIDPGFSNAQEIQTIRISIPDAEAATPANVIQTEQRILTNIAGLPGVSSVGITNTVPMDGGANDPVYAEDHDYGAGKLPPIRRYKYVSPGYVAAIGSRLIAGRDLTWAETYHQAPVAFVSENLAREWWRDPRAAIGKRIRPTPMHEWREVVGVVADLRDKGVDHSAPAIAYWPLLTQGLKPGQPQVQRNVAYMIRTRRAGTTAFLNDVRAAVWSVNRNLPVAGVRTLQAVYDQSLGRTSFTLLLLTIAGAVALLLGVIGIYGVISYSVAKNVREIGIRLALGAPQDNVMTMFVRHGLTLTAIGAFCGLAAALPLTRLMKSLLFDVTPTDPLTYVAVSAVLLGAAALASYLPARRAAGVDPAEALRAE